MEQGKLQDRGKGLTINGGGKSGQLSMKQRAKEDLIDHNHV